MPGDVDPVSAQDTDMIKWIKKAEHELFRKRIFALKDIECYHPEKMVNHTFFTIDTYDWINVVARTDDGRFVMVRQHRLGTDEITLETPGGIIEGNETPRDTALRELREETGYEAAEIHLLKKLSANPAILNNYIHFYYAAGCRRIHAQDLDLSEDIEAVSFTRDEIMEMISSGAINHSVVITALYLYFLSPWSGLADRSGGLSPLT